MPVAKFRKVSGQVFWAYGVVSAVDGLLDITYCGVHPSELVFGDAVRPATRDDANVAALCLFDGGETRQAVRNDRAAGLQVALCPTRHFRQAEAFDHVHVHHNRMACLIQRHRRHKRHFVGRTPPPVCRRASRRPNRRRPIAPCPSRVCCHRVPS
jgi:hypothetical protein